VAISGARQPSADPPGALRAPVADLGSLEFWGRPAEERDAYFAWLRDEAPISRHEPPEDVLGCPNRGA
jgi:hypothetical protein